MNDRLILTAPTSEARDGAILHDTEDCTEVLMFIELADLELATSLLVSARQTFLAVPERWTIYTTLAGREAVRDSQAFRLEGR